MALVGLRTFGCGNKASLRAGGIVVTRAGKGPAHDADLAAGFVDGHHVTDMCVSIHMDKQIEREYNKVGDNYTFRNVRWSAREWQQERQQESGSKRDSKIVAARETAREWQQERQ